MLKNCPHPLCHRDNDELAQSHAALLEAGKELFESSGHVYSCPEKMGLPCVCGFHERSEKWVKAEAIAQRVQS